MMSYSMTKMKTEDRENEPSKRSYFGYSSNAIKLSA